MFKPRIPGDDYCPLTSRDTMNGEIKKNPHKKTTLPNDGSKATVADERQ